MALDAICSSKGSENMRRMRKVVMWRLRALDGLGPVALCYSSVKT